MKFIQKYNPFFISVRSIILIVLFFSISIFQKGFSNDFFNSVNYNGASISNLKDPQTNEINVNVFEVLANPKEITIEKGSSGTISITVNRATDFTGQVNLSIFPSPGLPAYVNAPFTPSSLPANTSASVLTLEVGEEAISGTYNVVIAGTGSQDGTTKLRTVSISLTITDPQPPGVVASVNFLDGNTTIDGLSNINNNITLDIEDLPEVINFSANTNGPATAVGWEFNEQGNPNIIQSYKDESTPYTLYPEGGWVVQTGVYVLRAAQFNNEVRGEVKSIVITIESVPPPSFDIVASPSALTITQGESKSTEVTLTPVNNFTGQVDLLTDDLPEGVEGFFSITTLDTEGTSILRFEVDERAPVGSYSIRVRAVGSNQLSANTIVELNINRASAADFELISNINSLNIIKGESGKVNLTIRPLNGFNQTVIFKAESSDNLVDFQFSPSEVMSGNGTTELTISTIEEIELGSIEINVFAIADTVERSVSLDVTIDPIPIELKPSNQFSPNGDGIDEVWVVEEILELPDHTIVVFDRSGKEVLKAQPYKNDWNGKSQNGVDLPPTTYFFTIKDAGGKLVKSGSINLLR